MDEGSRAFLPSQRKNYYVINKHVFKRFRASQFKELKQDLISYQDKYDMKDFFAQYGGPILDWALIAAPTAESLSFLYENIPSDIFQEKLRNNNYSILKSYLLGQSGIEKHGLHNEEKQARRINKLGVLLAIDFDGVKKFMQENYSKAYVTNQMKTAFESALKQHKEVKPSHEKHNK